MQEGTERRRENKAGERQNKRKRDGEKERGSGVFFSEHTTPDTPFGSRERETWQNDGQR